MYPRMSRTDIYLMAVDYGMDDLTAWNLALDLSPECRCVERSKVVSAIRKAVS